MNKQYIIKAVLTGLYLLVGKGFTATAAAATRLTAEAADQARDCAAQLLGLETSSEEVIARSFAVGYVRASDLVGGQVNANNKNPSRRRFATIEEARQHGSRFAVRKAKGSRVAGSAGHIGYYTIETTDPVNAAVNPATGLTNKL